VQANRRDLIGLLGFARSYGQHVVCSLPLLVGHLLVTVPSWVIWRGLFGKGILIGESMSLNPRRQSSYCSNTILMLQRTDPRPTINDADREMADHINSFLIVEVCDSTLFLPDVSFWLLEPRLPRRESRPTMVLIRKG
jgi:hypothetical protein